MKKSLVGLSALVVCASPAYSMQFSAQLKPLNLPILISTDAPPIVKHTPPSTIAVSALRYCGDGDVASFSSSNPTFQFMPQSQTSIPVIAGFWVVEDTGSDVLPSNGSGSVPANWFPVAYKNISIAEKPSDVSSVDKFYPVTHSDSNVSSLMAQMKSNLVGVYGLAKGAFKTNKSYKIMAGVFGCPDPDESSVLTSDGSGDYRASPVQLFQNLSQLDGDVSDVFDTTNFNQILQKTKKIKIELKANKNDWGLGTSDARPYKFVFGESGDTELSGQLYNRFKDILNVSMPDPATNDTLDKYKAAMQASNISSIMTNLSSADKIAYCNDQGADSSINSKIYGNLEIFPMNLTCKKLFDTDALANAAKDLFNPSSLPSADVFKQAQKNLAKRFLLAASLQAVQRTFNTASNYQPVRPGCFKKAAQQHLIHRLVASYPFTFQKSSGKYVIKGMGSVAHPEPSFAIGGYTAYFNSNNHAIWGQFQLPSDLNSIRLNSILLPLNDPSLLSTPVDDSSFAAPININFHIRSVGGSCPFYC